MANVSDPTCPDCDHTWKRHLAAGGCVVVGCRCTEPRAAAPSVPTGSERPDPFGDHVRALEAQVRANPMASALYDLVMRRDAANAERIHELEQTAARLAMHLRCEHAPTVDANPDFGPACPICKLLASPEVAALPPVDPT